MNEIDKNQQPENQELLNAMELLEQARAIEKLAEEKYNEIMAIVDKIIYFLDKDNKNE